MARAPAALNLQMLDELNPNHAVPHQGDTDTILLRQAQPSDIPALLAIEERCFATDRLTRRSFQYLLTKAKATALVEAHGGPGGGRVVGYALVSFHSGTSLARLYSFAVDPDFRGQGVAKRLLAAAEQAARSRDCIYLRLEVRRDNTPAINLYKKSGYREFGVYTDYYEDHMEALRLEKRLGTAGPSAPLGGPMVPYYQQTLDFTCGPSALMMAMKALKPAEIELGRKLEIRLWRESTTVFMTSGHGGCGPFGLALAAARRGLKADIYVKDSTTPFLDSVRSDDKKEVMRIVHEDFLEELDGSDVTVHHSPLTAEDMAEAVKRGAIPIVLISSYRIYHEKFPHWVVVTGADDRFLYVHDPLVYDRHHAHIDRMNMPIPKADFERMARYGKAQLKATILLSGRSAD
ncbi:GNAT family N-acetyltransferase/peptidase C39 family protein [Azospirillum rugosum]|uniref:Ribosomal-protein-alanine acetyltransferase n=1 Tax=Azospirillum rugosum TaxID=416170 RepID=A0ABS4SDH3_9PROT|nr:GNAT family N-acetyltransferase/peptidase C39 family protein [Azospirillum rugosum]MBP2290616.1 ribosomal-protein-alanine acetyltransferase [Azospirillum rugosum]MDQ0525504.1 ribosomal-protein-alanine acetyltransferase [Azospirillum rugosum]